MADRTADSLLVHAHQSPDGCLLWTGARSPEGYGRLANNLYAHRLAYELLVGPIPNGMQIDHLCRVRHCINPDHLEAVTQRENILRGISPAAHHARQTHCINGHEFTPDNTYTPPSRPNYRGCRECCRERDRRREPGWYRGTRGATN